MKQFNCDVLVVGAGIARPLRFAQTSAGFAVFVSLTSLSPWERWRALRVGEGCRGRSCVNLPSHPLTRELSQRESLFTGRKNRRRNKAGDLLLPYRYKKSRICTLSSSSSLMSRLQMSLDFSSAAAYWLR